MKKLFLAVTIIASITLSGCAALTEDNTPVSLEKARNDIQIEVTKELHESALDSENAIDVARMVSNTLDPKTEVMIEVSYTPEFSTPFTSDTYGMLQWNNQASRDIARYGLIRAMVNRVTESSLEEKVQVSGLSLYWIHNSESFSLVDINGDGIWDFALNEYVGPTSYYNVQNLIDRGAIEVANVQDLTLKSTEKLF